jgi:UDP-N-acetylmuramoylalanine--D-glutamate ligase
VITSALWRGKRYAVLGLARSGAATVHALLASGAQVVAWDEDAGARAALKAEPLQRRGRGGDCSLNIVATQTNDSPHPNPSPEREGLDFADPLTLDLTGFEAVVASPGVPLNRHPIAAHAATYGVPVIGDIELFAQARAELQPHKVVGITGTNGKSTTTALVHHILKTARVPVTMGGNIGLPILGQDPLPAEGVYVLELSSFQIDLTFTLDCDVAVLLNVTPDHLDRYDGFEAYAASKARLFAMQSTDHAFVISLDWGGGRVVAAQSWMYRDAQQCGWFRASDVDASSQATWLTLQGKHNAENAQAAINACIKLSVSEELIKQALRTYPGLPHRMERIREVGDVRYVNDSKATNPTSTAPALAAYPAVHWIVGGQAKTQELDACAPHFGHVRAAYTIGRDGPMLAALLRPHMSVTECGDLSEAVRLAACVATPGETVLLSPACASFDQFANFEARGDAFRALVEGL